ncbi:MAG: DsbA family protein [Candidatus Nanosalina sp.]
MEECDFCGEEFESKKKLHLHWGEKHEEELNSHQEEKVKKAKRQRKEEKGRNREKRKRQVFYGLGAVLLLGLTALIIPQLMPSGNSQVSGNLDLAGQPMQGDPNASVTVVEFGDYRCPYCARFEQSVFPKLKEQYIETGKVKFYFVNMAFLGPGSTEAAVAAECVYRQDEQQFWDFHHAIYENQGPESERWVTQELLMNLARNGTDGLDYGKLRQCISDQETLPEVLSDKEIARKNGVSSTPTIFVNGEKIQGNSFEAVKSAVERELE